MGQQLSQQSILEELRRQGITSLEQLASYAEKNAQRQDADGAPVVNSVFITPHYVGSH